MHKHWTTTLALLSIVAPAVAAEDEAAMQFFETKVRPVLAEHCYKCHSTQSEKLKGGLLVDSRGGLLKGGDNGPAVVAGQPEQSRLIEAVSYHNVDLQMPPKRKLSDGQIADLSAWVKAGAQWPEAGGGPVAAVSSETFDLQKRKAEHWAWHPARPQSPPAVKNSGWPKEPVDAFVLAKLEEKGLQPAPPADRRALVRRAYFDLIGLPPAPEEVEAFANDNSPNAFGKLVDHLLASPHFGERWGRHWLDLVRYAESRGHEFDYEIPNAFQYRDYVIRALNADVPYDQFVTEHIAGDLLREPRRDSSGRINESVLATGFWFMGEWVHSPVDIRKDETDRVDNQIDVMTKALLGMTVSCARCHDHKFDAISAKDYYGLAGFLHSSSYRDVRFQFDDHNRDVARRLQVMEDETRAAVVRSLFNAQKPAPDRTAEYLLAARELLRGDGQSAAPTDRVLRVAEQRKLDPAALAVWLGRLARARGDVFDPLHPWSLIAHDPADPTPQRLAELLKPVGERWRTELAEAAGAAGKVSVVVDYSAPGPGDWITDGLGFGDGPTRPGQALLGSAAEGPIRISTEGVARSDQVGPGLPAMLRTPTFTVTAPTLWYRVAGAGQAFVVVDSHRMIGGPLHGTTRRSFKVDGPPAWQSHDLSGYLGHRAHVEFTAADPASAVAVAAVAQSATAPPEPVRANALVLKLLTEQPVQSAEELAGRYQSLLAETAELAAADRLAAAPDAADRARVAGWIVEQATPPAAGNVVFETLAEYSQERAKLLSELKDSPTAMAVLEGSPVDEQLLIRGNAKTPGERVPRRFLEAVAGPNQPRIAAGSGRLELARQITDPANPLTARVRVNRVWHHLFGRGIVPSVDNFGVLGQAPTHPELLDFLADRFVKEGWSTKKLIRELMLSSTYQMSSRADARAQEADPQNLLLHHMPIRRLEGEAIRDSILAISGRLDRRMFGPSVDVYLTGFMEGRGRPASGPLDGAGRRSVYIKVRRNFLSPMMLAFDTPIPFNTMGRRSVSNVPAQALILMNDPFVVEQARAWADRVLSEKDKTPAQRVSGMYAAAFARPPSEQEVADALAFLDGQGQEYGVAPGPRADDPRAWADLAHVLMNVKEFVFVN